MKAILRKSAAKEPFSFIFVNAEGTTVLKSENYAAKDSAKSGIESVKKNSVNPARYESKQAKDGREFFNLKSGNGQVVGTSPLYADAAQRDQAIEVLQREAPNASVENQGEHSA